MKLVYLADSSIPSQGADAVHVMSICKAFADNGCDVTLIAQKSKLPDNPFEYYGIKENLFEIILVERPNIRVLGGFIYGSRVKRVFKKIDKPDLIYARSINSLHKINPDRTLFIYESHWKPKNKVYFRFEHAFLKKKNLVSLVVISHGLLNIYEELFPWAKSKFTVLHDACHMPAKVGQNQNERLQVAYIGSFFKGNGYELIPIMAERMQHVDFHVIGGNEPLLSNLRDHNVLPNLNIHGHVAHKYLNGMYPNFDVMLAPYQKCLPHIGWVSPMKLFEYMSYAKPIIASDFPVIREVLNEDNSILVEAESVDAWCDAIKELEAVDLRRKLGQNAYDLFVEKYTWGARVKEILKLYEKNT